MTDLDNVKEPVLDLLDVHEAESSFSDDTTDVLKFVESQADKQGQEIPSVC